MELLGKCPQVASDYSFLNLWAWAEDYGLHWAWEDDLVWIKQTYPETFLWAPVGPWHDIEWDNQLPAEPDGPTIFIRIPDKLAEHWQAALKDRATFEEERGHWDSNQFQPG